MPQSDWSDQYQELFNHTPGTDALEDHERGYVEALFEAGFTYRAEDYDSMGLDPDQVYMYREEFFQYMGMDASDFDWQEWREAMGYE